MEKHVKAATFLANILDNSIHIGQYSFGLSALVDLIPGIGDIIDAMLSFYIVWIAFRMEIPILVILRMIYNIVVNFIIGLIPVVGDVIYVLRKVNLKNVALLKQYAQPPVEQGKIIA